MGDGAVFLLLLIVIFIAIVGGTVWAILSALRLRKRNGGEDKVERHMLDEGTAAEPHTNGAPARRRGAGRRQSGQDERRPEHHAVGSEQSTRSISRR